MDDFASHGCGASGMKSSVFRRSSQQDAATRQRSVLTWQSVPRRDPANSLGPFDTYQPLFRRACLLRLLATMQFRELASIVPSPAPFFIMMIGVVRGTTTGIFFCQKSLNVGVHFLTLSVAMSGKSF